MEKLNKREKESLNALLNSFNVGEYQKTLIRSILSNNEKKNLSKADKEISQDLIRRFN